MVNVYFSHLVKRAAFCLLLLATIMLALAACSRKHDAAVNLPVKDQAKWQDLFIGCWKGRGDLRAALGTPHVVFFEIQNITWNDQFSSWFYEGNRVEVHMEALRTASHPHEAMRVASTGGPILPNGLSMLLGPVRDDDGHAPKDAIQPFDLRLQANGRTLLARRQPGVGATVYFDKIECALLFESLLPSGE